MKEKNIVILDDDIFICDSLQLLLSDRYNIFTFNNIENTKKYLETNHQKVDLIILDYNIGKDNGIDFYLSEIKNKNINIPGIMISGFLISHLKDNKEIQKLNKYFVKLFEKPFDIVELKTFINEWFKIN